MAETERKTLPPYMPYRSFLTFLDHLRAVGMPSHIDKGAMASMSGAMQSWTKASLRYMRLIDADDVPDERLKKLANAQGDERKALLRELFASTYGFLKVDLSNTTAPKLREAIAELGAQGETVEKVIAFLVAMGKDANVPLSAYLTKRAPRVRRTKNTARKEGSGNGTPAPPRGDAPDQNDPGVAMKTVMLPGAGGDLTLSGTFNTFDLEGDERDLVFFIIDKMKAFEKAHPPEEEEEP